MTNSIQGLLEDRYYRPGETQWSDIALRVAEFLFPEATRLRGITYTMLRDMRFIPSSPVLMNAGAPDPMLCSCFVLPVKDSIADIMSSLTDTVMIQKYGGGVGLNLSAIRPEGSIVHTTQGRASGPVSFAGFWNEAMNVIKQGGKRQGAMMGVLNIDHPDLPLFLAAKEQEGKLTNFNLSVGFTGEYFDDLYSGADKVWPHGWDTVQVLQQVAARTWHNGEPGMLFLDNINRNNPYGIPIEATNPCGEVPLPPYGACCLGSLNLSSHLRFHKEGVSFDFDSLREDTNVAIVILNAVLDRTWWPTQAIADFEKQFRPLGLGVMGLAEVLAVLRLPYDSEQGREFVNKVMGVIREEAEYSNWDSGYNNTVLLSIAPTGTISMIADTSYSIEPFFSWGAVKTVEAGTFRPEDRVLHRVAMDYGHKLTPEDMRVIGETGSVMNTSLPSDAKEVLKNATEISWKNHLLMQATVQRWVDNAVSKTINMPYETTVGEVQEAILMAHDLGLKGMTMYRSGSRDDEVFSCPTGSCPL